jgi:hypothetical protein
MPIYEFFCPQSRRIYSFFARSLSYADKVPRCPENPKWKMEKMVSSFAVTGRAKEKSDAPGGGAEDDPRLERAMAEMEREFAGVGESDNPDPRLLAKMMRKMSDLAGEKVPAVMQEMLARLEKGEDPERLEAEYGDSLDAMDDQLGDSPELEAAAATLRRRRKRVSRDPTLYEMADFVD